ncbi:lipopolysaccharide export system permease protein [Desulfobotulus alkaliphilus]|uniref:Lipopolysaccharide export system permease protein n=1 Tax=Desulfobotulus alkaliphilus TaxID=622671 RepID=A0A562R6W5_9BACT|nr:LPS export ABC transporter permease LptF [Desulfobotulus alkaliphilus]TWI64818.1 lipopolysaccharide export system permease protein [Desulfobotulus alkaliphilus]
MHRVDRYFFSQMLFPFFLNIFFFTLIFLITQLLDIADLIVNYGTGVSAVALLLAYSAPFFLQFTIPLAVMVTVLITFLRLSGDREILALKAGGFSSWRFLPPVLFFCLLAALITAGMTIYGLPWGKLESRKLVAELAMKHGSMILKPMVFNDMFSGVTLYAGEMDKETGSLKDIFIEDYREKEGMGTIIAPEGRLQMDADTGMVLIRLSNGMILRGDDLISEVHAIAFENYDLRLNLAKEKGDALGGRPKDKEEMGFSELREHIRKLPEGSRSYNAAVIKLHEKFSFPLACFVLGIIAFSLGISSMERKRSPGLSAGLGFFLVYYAFLTMGWSFGESGVFHPGIAIWTPNLVLGVVGGWMLFRVAGEKTLIPQFIYVLKIHRGERG